MNHDYSTLRSTLAATGLLLGLCAAQAAELVVIGNPAASPLTKEQVADVFLGKDTHLSPVDQPESSPLRVSFYKAATGREPAQVKTAWSRLVFSGKAQPPKEVADSAAVKKLVAADAKAVGYIEKSAVDASVKVLASVE